jgi:uncharacterized coiled-coil DUF342 family protein
MKINRLCEKTGKMKNEQREYFMKIDRLCEKIGKMKNEQRCHLS